MKYTLIVKYFLNLNFMMGSVAFQQGSKLTKICPPKKQTYFAIIYKKQ